GEFERAAVLRDRADDMIRDTSGNLGVDLQRHSYRGPDKSDQVREDLVSDLARIAPDTFLIERDCGVKALGFGRCSRSWLRPRRWCRYWSWQCHRCSRPTTRLGRRHLRVDLLVCDLRAYQESGV